MWEVLYWLAVAAIAVLGGVFIKALIDDYVSPVVWAPIALLSLLALGVGSYFLREELFTYHPVYELDKRSWVCTQRHTEIITTYVSNGNGGMTPIITSHQVCDQYNRT